MNKVSNFKKRDNKLKENFSLKRVSATLLLIVELRFAKLTVQFFDSMY